MICPGNNVFVLVHMYVTVGPEWSTWDKIGGGIGLFIVIKDVNVLSDNLVPCSLGAALVAILLFIMTVKVVTTVA